MALVPNNTSDIVIFFPSDEVDVNVPNDHIAIGGTVSTQAPANTVDVTEHSFLALQTDVEVVLFDNTNDGSIADHQLVLFADPMHDLVASGITLHKSNCNYAVVSGTGTLIGKRYTHTTTVMSVSNQEDDEDVRLKQVTDNCLINEINSRSTAERVLSYFSEIDRIKSKLFLTTERTGDLIRFRNPFKEKVDAYIEKMDVMPTSIIGADCEMIKGFNPQFIGNDFDNAVLITQDGTWVVPADTTRIKVVLIGGGQGGQGGAWGQNGANLIESGGMSLTQNSLGLYTWVYGYTGSQPLYDGGAAGAPGSGGYILALYFDVTPGDVLTFDIGAGGAGGAVGAIGGKGQSSYRRDGDLPGELGEMGEPGEHTTLTYNGETYTTESGNISQTGYLYLFENRIFGAPGEAGHNGGAGGQTNSQSLNGWQYANGLAGGSVGQWNGGAGGKGIKAKWWTGGADVDINYNEASGGGGGGAAWGANGKSTHYRDYPAGTFNNNPVFKDTTSYAIRCAFGGDGANASKPGVPKDSQNRVNYGQGGGGGNRQRYPDAYSRKSSAFFSGRY